MLAPALTTLNRSADSGVSIALAISRPARVVTQGRRVTPTLPRCRNSSGCRPAPGRSPPAATSNWLVIDGRSMNTGESA